MVFPYVPSDCSAYHVPSQPSRRTAGPGQSILEGPLEGESSSGGRGSSRRDAPGSGSGNEAAVEIEVVQAPLHSEASTSSSPVGWSVGIMRMVCGLELDSTEAILVTQGSSFVDLHNNSGCSAVNSDTQPVSMNMR